MAVSWDGIFDPAEVLEYEMDFLGGEDPVLEDGEEIASFSVALTPEAVLYGLTIREDGLYAPALDDSSTKVILWFEMEPADQDHPDFVDGVIVGVEGTIVTNSTPARTRQRTWLLTVQQL